MVFAHTTCMTLKYDDLTPLSSQSWVEDDTGQHNAPLFVGLYMVLLAFFIILTALSTVDPERLDQASDSVAEAFSFKQPLINVPEIFLDTGTEVTSENYFETLRKLAADSIAFQDLDVQRAGNTMQVSINIDKVFLSDAADMSREAIILFDNVASVMKSWQYQLDTNIKITIPFPEPEFPTLTNAETLANGRSISLLLPLLEAGVEPSRILPAISNKKSTMLTLTFEVYNEKTLFKPLIDKGDTPS